MDLHRGVQTFLRFGAGKILGMQHGSRRQTHHGCDAGGHVCNYRKKSCQDWWGVYCAVSTSLLVQKPVSVVSKEIVNRAKRIPGLIKQAAVRNDEIRMTNVEGMTRNAGCAAGEAGLSKHE